MRLIKTANIATTVYLLNASHFISELKPHSRVIPRRMSCTSAFIKFKKQTYIVLQLLTIFHCVKLFYSVKIYIILILKVLKSVNIFKISFCSIIPGNFVENSTEAMIWFRFFHAKGQVIRKIEIKTLCWGSSVIIHVYYYERLRLQNMSAV